MSFAVFRKYQKPIMWVTVVASVFIFATFSGFGDVKNLLQKHETVETFGEFDVQSTGQRQAVTTAEFHAARQAMARFAHAQGRKNDLEDPEVWGHLIRLAEARGAGLDVTDRDVNDFVQGMVGNQPLTRDLYTQLWRDVLQFASAREMERFLHDVILGSRWAEFEIAAAGIVDADDVYLRWRQDNERFDYEAVVVPDLTEEQIPAPSEDDLKSLWDETPESVRAATYVEPRKVDVIYAWVALAEGEHSLPADKLAALPEPTEDELQQRFDTVGEVRWPDATALTDAMKPELAREAKIITAAERAQGAFEAGTDKTPEAFRKVMEEAGLTVIDPEGLLGSEDLAALPEIGTETLPLWLAYQPVGTVYVGTPDVASQDDVHLVLVQAEQPSRPLSFEEAHDKLVKSWREGRRDKPAKEFRDAVRKAARELPDCAAAVQPLVDAAQKRADEAAAALTDATDEQREAARKSVLDAAERGEIAARVGEFESQVWDTVPRPEGARVLTFTSVPKSYSRNPTGDEEPTSVERHLKVASAIFRLGVGGISEPLRHAPSSQTSVVIVRARNFAEQGDMLADSAGLESARRQLSAQRASEAQRNMTAEALMANRNLKVAETIKRTPTDDTGVPPDF